VIADTLATLKLHFHRANAAFDEAQQFADALCVAMLDDYEKVKVLDSFILRFIKIQDLMGHKLFRELLDGVGEYELSMSMLDVLDRLEKLGFIKNAERWLDYRNLRNILTHEYPDSQKEMIEGIQMAMRAFVEIRETYLSIVAYVEQRGLV